ncbi:hypothetical protein BCP8-2_143 [Bacillus phage BCP8-2]|uniref:Uncharacterized protein n=1 Tax=Bacillus phage BCP8-2 TaxID=1129192 RepID=A0A0E3D9I3_9CAUD|nr:HNH endonuclease [Bacillus phage BCP8-2]AHJ87181.1 hypothetical protein BCP8-2_143 [Bacillus phage BCP8-2]
MAKKIEASERVGTVGVNNYGSPMKVVWYENSKKVIVQFEQGNVVQTSWQLFVKGSVKNPYDKTLLGVGYMGLGRHSSKTEDGEDNPIYYTWLRMMKRCYDKNTHKRQPAYINCTVDEKWHNFQNFAEWYEENYYEVEGETMCLDKDIKVKGNKIYSPDTCIFAPTLINNLFITNDSRRGELPVGVVYDNKHDKYIAQYRTPVGKQWIGRFKTAEEAFLAYKEFKELYIKKVAEEYKGKIPHTLYNIMMNYKIEIDD